MKFIKFLSLAALAFAFIRVGTAAASQQEQRTVLLSNNLSIAKQYQVADTGRPTKVSKMQKAKKLEPSKADTAIVSTLQEDGIDPVCHMKVKKGATLTSTYKGKQYGFCNPSCKERFDKKPEEYIK